ncbi:MAG: DUF1599 domain-containing protein [Flavobacteriales bacterium]|nr:DUF1599 domain-containing protein [Flavobacteriales bacterium]
MSDKTTTEYTLAVQKSKDIFLKKMEDYGTAWRILRTSSITDQIFIKAKRIRSIEQKAEQRVEEGIEPEFIGIVNYSIIALMQLEIGELVMHEEDTKIPEVPKDQVESRYDYHIGYAYNLMSDKNHDYDEAWRDMRISSLTDLILMKLLRVKEIENNKGQTLISEGIDANYHDIINYAIFALIKLEGESTSR